MAEASRERRSGRWQATFMAALTLLVVAGIAGGGWRLLQRDLAPGPPRQVAGDAREPVDATADPARPRLAAGADYYVHVRLVELRGDNAGSSWDAGGGAPDLVVKTFWNGTKVHDSAERGDSLTGEWDLLRIDLKDAVLQQAVDVAGAINAPLVQGGAGGLVSVEVWDDDDASFSDLAGRFDLPAELLSEGVNRLSFDAGNVARLELDLVPARLSLPELLERYSDR